MVMIVRATAFVSVTAAIGMVMIVRATAFVSVTAAIVTVIVTIPPVATAIGVIVVVAATTGIFGAPAIVTAARITGAAFCIGYDNTAVPCLVIDRVDTGTLELNYDLPVYGAFLIDDRVAGTPMARFLGRGFMGHQLEESSSDCACLSGILSPTTVPDSLDASGELVGIGWLVLSGDLWAGRKQAGW